MRIKLFVCVSFCIVLCLAVGCTPSIPPYSSTKEASATQATEGTSAILPIQSDSTPNVEEDTMSDYLLIVNGKDITSGNYIKVNKDYIDLPFTAVMKALGGQVVWKDKTTAEITYGDKSYILEPTSASLVEVGGIWNIILAPPGGICHCQVVEDEFILDNVTMKSALSHMDKHLNLSIDRESKIINIDYIDQ